MALKFLIDLLTGNLVLVNVPAGGPVLPDTALLTEIGDYFLSELGDYLIQE